jgi:hypothetical protein
MCAKYYGDSSLWTITHTTRVSALWGAIVDGWEFFRGEVHRELRDKETVHDIGQPWFPN